MEEDFKIEIISPEKIIFSSSTKIVQIPSYEGQMSILKNHIPIVTFLRPGIVKVGTNNVNTEDFFLEDGTVEFFNNILVLLSSSIINIKNLSKNFIEGLTKKTQKELDKIDITDQDRYILNHKLEALKEISI